MTNLQGTNRRIIGVRTKTARPILFCEAGDFSPKLGDWVMVEQDNATFPARVVLPDRLIEAAPLTGPLPKIIRPAEDADLLQMAYGAGYNDRGNDQALLIQAHQLFAEVSAAHKMPYYIQYTRMWPDHLAIIFSAGPEPTIEDYVTLLKGLAEIYPVRIELYIQSEATVGLIIPGKNLVNWVNALLVELDPAVMANATVGESLLDEAAVYRPGHRPGVSPPLPPALQPAAVYDPTTNTLSVGGQQVNPPG